MVEGVPRASSSPASARTSRSSASCRRYRRGDVLFHQGDDAGAVLVLLGGHVKAGDARTDGREVILAFPGPGELLGELSAVDGAAALGDRARGRRRRGARHPRAALPRPSSSSRPRIALVLLRSVAARLRDADRQRVDYAVNDVVVRVAGRLVELCDRYGAEDEAGIDVGLGITPGRARRLGGRVARGGREGDGAVAHAGLGRRPSAAGIIVLDLPALRRTRADARRPVVTSVL